MSSTEYRRWQIYHDRVGLPDLNWLFAQVCQLTYNANRGQGKKALSTERFLPRDQRQRRKRPLGGQSADEVKSIIQGAARRTTI